MIVLEVIVGLALLKALALIVTMTCVDFYKVLGYDLWIDLAIGFGLLASTTDPHTACSSPPWPASS